MGSINKDANGFDIDVMPKQNLSAQQPITYAEPVSGTGLQSPILLIDPQSDVYRYQRFNVIRSLASYNPNDSHLLIVGGTGAIPQT